MTKQATHIPSVTRNSEMLLRYWQEIVPHSEYYQKLLLSELPGKGFREAVEIAGGIPFLPFTHKSDLVNHLDEFLLRARSEFAPADWQSHTVAQYGGPYVDCLSALDLFPSTDPQECFSREWLPIHFQRSGGSTGQTIITAYTWTDIFGPFRESARFLYRITGIAPDDLVFNLCPAAPHLGIYATLILPILIGQPNFNTFGGKVMATTEQVELASRLQPAALVGITSYVAHWVRVAAKLVADGVVSPLERLRTVVAVGEPVSTALRGRIEDLLAQAGSTGTRVLEGMGSTEMRAVGFYECTPGGGLHVDDERFFVELIDPDTQRPVNAGEPGVLVWSHIGWRGHAVLRYWSGDFVHGGMTLDTCSHCGLDGPRLRGPITRYERDFVKIRGARVELLALLDAIRSVPGVRTFQVTVRKDTLSDPTSRDLLEVALAGADPGKTIKVVRAAVAHAAEVTPDAIEWTDEEEVDRRLFAHKLKAEEFVDLR